MKFLEGPTPESNLILKSVIQKNLNIILGYQKSNSRPWVTWIYNPQTKVFEQPHRFLKNNHKEAIQDFKERSFYWSMINDSNR